MDETPLTFISNTPTSSPKFSLYLKARELREISKVLETVTLLPEKQRKAWAQEHGEIINQAIELLVQDSNATLSELTLDDETLELSKELITSLRDTVEMAQGILYSSRNLTS